MPTCISVLCNTQGGILEFVKSSEPRVDGSRGSISLGKGRYLREAANVDVSYMYIYEVFYRYIIGEFASRDFAICLCKDIAGELRLIDTLVIYEGDLQQFATRVYV